MADISSLSDDQLLSSLAPSRASQASFTPASFAQQYGSVAQAAGQKLGVDPSLLLGQWGLETGWGKSVIPGTNNLGNIKDMTGAGVAARDNMTGSNDRYRTYATPQAFADDYADLISRKYPGVVGSGSDSARFATALKAGGYAEDPNYVAKLQQVISTAQRAQPSTLARVGNAVASAVSGTANAATPQELSGISDADLLAALASRGVQTPKPQPQRSTIDELGRQAGLTVRAAGHGIADALGLVANPVNALINTVTGSKLQDVDTLIRRGVDAITPTPANTTERVVGDIAGAVANPVNLVGGQLASGATSTLGAIGRGAVAGAATAGMQPLHADDTLGDYGKRIGAGAVGGAAGAAAGQAIGAVADKVATGIDRVMSAVRARIPSNQLAAQVSADDLLAAAARDQNIDLRALSENVRNGLRNQAAEALASNRTIDAPSLLRQAEGNAILGPGNGLTLGQATRDPMQFATERNMRGIVGAGEPLAERFAGQNRALIDSLNQRGAANAQGEFATGQRLMGALGAVDDAANTRVGQLYDTARGLNGGDIPLNGQAFAQQANDVLDRNLAQAHLPEWARKTMNQISSGEIPLTVGVGEQFKTQLATAIRSAKDGNERYALGAVRNALESASPLDGAIPAVGSNQLVTAEQAALRASPGDQALSAFNAARDAARARFGTIESNPGLRAVVNGDAVPDNFFKRYVLNGNVRDVNSLMGIVPDQGASLRNQIVDYLKQKALNGASDEVGVFSQSAYNKALNSLGDAKLNALFPPEQVAQLKQIGRVASYIQAQPAGSAVNNSNTASAGANLALGALDRLGKVPGLNIARNSINQFLNERATGQALASQIDSVARPVSADTVNQLLPFLPGVAGAASVPDRR
ncbi:glycoside hydrolase family 73 protein [Pandoraea commovens]|uniref:Flagellar rod assembly protein/muramidase FlgJ n=1 Tax=Pandoraea commovens TaxID=2508289 RepID=A0A5E4VGJ4_9BURK|nr:glucosaminidase domain-containing protein [Pandoraea commovens]VVE10684.1 flagellar rod assembly protein/muramidase FlgJ [Pandoraea commovens]